MFLSDMRYLRIRSQLRDIMQDTRGGIPSMEMLTEELKKAEDNTEREFKCFQRYFNNIDYNRTLEFYTALRDLRQNGTQIPYLGFTITSIEGALLARQTEMFAREITKIRKGKAA